MNYGSHPGWIEVISGVMFSGKSEELIRRVRRALIAQRRVQVFKSALDDRYAGVRTISSHDGSGVEAVPVRSAAEVAEHVADGFGARTRDTPWTTGTRGFVPEYSRPSWARDRIRGTLPESCACSRSSR